MKTEHRELLKRLVRSLVAKIVPRSFRKEYMDAWDERYTSLWQLVSDSARDLVRFYRVLAIAALDKTLVWAQLAAGLLCFRAASPLPLSLLIVLGSILGALTLRDAYTHLTNRSRATLPSAQSYVDSAVDAAAADISLFVTEALMLAISPSLAVPPTVLCRGAFVCLPLLFALRMVLIPKADAKNPFNGSIMTAEAMYKRVRRLNILWMAAVVGTILISAPLMPAWFPEFLRGFIPVKTFAVWFDLQRTGLWRRDDIQTLFEDLRKKKLTQGGKSSRRVFPNTSRFTACIGAWSLYSFFRWRRLRR